MAADIVGRELTAQRLRELLRYDPETGVFTRRVKTSARTFVGKVAGAASSGGYLQIRVDSARYLAHRLAWLYMNGEWPKQCIDHINGIRTDNRITNLRDVSSGVNAQNVHNSKGRSGLVGVSVHRHGFVAFIGKNHSVTYLGIFKTAEEARAAYIVAKRQLHDGAR